MNESRQTVLHAMSMASTDIQAAIEKWANAPEVTSPTAELREFLDAAPDPLIVDCFQRALPFGTGGRRGPVGIGPAGINYHSTALTVCGHVAYLQRRGDVAKLRVVVANDTRAFADLRGRYDFMSPQWSIRGLTSRQLALFSCKVYEALGVEAYTNAPDDEHAYMATPELSFTIRAMGADGGLNVSASHNHPDDNGLKVYTSSGGQYCPPDDSELSQAVERAEIPQVVIDHLASGNGVARLLPEKFHDGYILNYMKLDDSFCASSKRLRAHAPIVYAPMCGTGQRSVGEVLTRAGYTLAIPPGQHPDGTFASIPMRSPNPEIPGVADPAIEFARARSANLVLSTDPDADRLGAEVADGLGKWRHLTGNQIAAITAFYLTLDPGGPRRQGQIVTTVATSRILRAIAGLSGCGIEDDLLIGFKYLGQALDEGSGHGAKSPLVLAAEESHGFLVSEDLRDKDAASAAFILAHLHTILTSRGSNLWDYLIAIYRSVGAHAELGRSLVLPGAEGARQIDALMQSLRETPLAQIGSEAVNQVRDMLDEGGGVARTKGELGARNLLVFSTTHYRMVVRPSGTEAKLKYYFDYVGEADPELSPASYDELALRVAKACSASYIDLAARAGYRLTEQNARLPDIQPLSEKATAQGGVTP